ncbi:MAG: DUF4127 family protein [Acidaminococcaceae bacterium]|nr:DUF4127 family protein [Acidaminococcaceae bacterium]
MKKILVLLVFLVGITALLYHNNINKIAPIEIKNLPTNSTCLLLPLDSRPPCLDFTEELAHLAGIKTVVPPNALLDSKERPAASGELQNWVRTNAPTVDNVLLATDLLNYGGLLQSRLAPLPATKANATLGLLEHLRQAYPTQGLYAYSIVPRLLVSDNLIPDRWYQWHLMRFSIMEAKRLQGLPYDTEDYAEKLQEIPPDIKAKYDAIYIHNQDFNNKLIGLAARENFASLIIGQDDTQKYSLSNYNLLSAQEVINKTGRANFYTTQGADEIGLISVANMLNHQLGYRPQVYVAFGQDRMRDLVLHFVSSSLEDIVQDKIRILGGSITDDITAADFVLFVHCGDDDIHDYTAIAAQVKEYMQQHKVALVDLSKNYQSDESLLPYLLANNTPLVQLAAYAGWNSASNAIGTALAQADIFTGRLATIQEEDKPSFYAANLRFNLARFLDDWSYQRLIRHKIAQLEEFNGISTTNTAPHTKLIEQYINRELQLYSKLLLITNLRRHPFYQNDQDSFYLTDLEYRLTLPWERTFEINLKVYPQFGKLI